MKLTDRQLRVLYKLETAGKALGPHDFGLVPGSATLSALVGSGLVNVAITLTDKGRAALASDGIVQANMLPTRLPPPPKHQRRAAVIALALAHNKGEAA